MKAANDSLRVNGIGRDAEDPRTLVIYFNEKPKDDDMRRIHDLLRDGAPEDLPRHNFWAAGDPDCPLELKARNGELHTTRCKVCGDGWRNSIDVCFAVSATAAPSDEGSAWLVERRAQGRTTGFLGWSLGSLEWFATASQATRFARRADANGVAEMFDDLDVIVAEHIWG